MWQNLRRQVQQELSTGIDLTRWGGSIALTVVVGIVYFLAARLSLALLTKPEGVAVFWPAAGVSAGVLIALGSRARWPRCIPEGGFPACRRVCSSSRTTATTVSSSTRTSRTRHS